MKQAAIRLYPAAGQAQAAVRRATAEIRYAALRCLAAYTAQRHAAAQSPLAPFWGGLPAPPQGFALPAQGFVWNVQGPATRKQRRAGIAARLAAIVNGFAAAAAGQARAAAGQSYRVQGHVSNHCPIPELSESHSLQGIQQKNSPRARSPDADRSPKSVVHGPRTNNHGLITITLKLLTNKKIKNMKKDNLPAQDAAFDAFQGNFITVVTANAMTWNIMATALALLTPLQAAWAAAYAIAKVKANRSISNIGTKNQARANYKAALRLFIKSNIYANTAMSDGDIIQCGLKPYDRTRTPIPVPTMLPIVNLQRAPGNFFTVRYYRLDDETGAIRRGKPDKVAKIEFAYNLGMQPVDPAGCTYHNVSTKGPIRVEVPAAMHGQTVWFYARWKNVYDAAGPWTDLDSFVL